MNNFAFDRLVSVPTAAPMHVLCIAGQCIVPAGARRQRRASHAATVGAASTHVHSLQLCSRAHVSAAHSHAPWQVKWDPDSYEALDAIGEGPPTPAP